MDQLPAGSVRDTAELAKRYSETSEWQRQRGLLLLEAAKPTDSQTVLDLGCGTGELSAELARRVGPSGRVIAIDPNPARLGHARTRRPPGLGNLVFEQASGEDLRPVANGTIDLVYSNYALHWMLDPPAVFGEIHRVLRPGGRFVAEFLGEPVELFVELILMMPGGEEVMEENVFLDEAEWREMISAHGFEVFALEWPQFLLTYASLGSLFAWLEATSHGAFDAEKIGPKDRAALERTFPGALSCPCKGLRMALRRPI